MSGRLGNRAGFGYNEALDLSGGSRLDAEHDLSLRQARRRLNELLDRVEAGEEFVISRLGTPVARLQPAGMCPRRRLGILNGQFTIPPDFDAPVPEIEDQFEGLAEDLESP